MRLRGWLAGSAAYRFFVDPQTRRARGDDVSLYVESVRTAVALARRKYGVPTRIAYIDSTEDFLAGAGFMDAMIVESFRKGGAAVVDVTLAKEEAEGARPEFRATAARRLSPIAPARSCRGISLKRRCPEFWFRNWSRPH